jgi:N-acetyl-anhydromuramyl-L-alanine amidase AmpD
MPKKIKIIIFATLSVFLIGAFFYFKKQNSVKKVELNLQTTLPVEQEAIIEKAEERSQPAEKTPAENQTTESVSEKPAEKKEVAKTDSSKLSITNRLVSFGFQKAQNRKIDTIIIHSSYDALGDDPYSVSGVIAEYKSYGVSPHYLIDRKGNVSRLVEDKNIAYHAGESKMSDGRTGVNAFSIGVEMLTTKKDKLTDAQYSALKLLISELKGKYEITSVLGHDQIAPGRKDDPWNFEWSRLK